MRVSVENNSFEVTSSQQLEKGSGTCSCSRATAVDSANLSVAMLTGGGDKPYALGIAEALTSHGVAMDFIGSDELDAPEVRNCPKLRFLNLRGDQSNKAGSVTKMLRVLTYYRRLLFYSLIAKPKIFHILWNNKFQFFDRTLLMFYYKLLGKRIVLTAHNVNIGKRDGNDTWANRFSLRTQYHLANHIFVHTKLMKQELLAEFEVKDSNVSVIPFGINSTLPNTDLTGAEARKKLGLNADEKVLLFFGNIAPYKGLEYLIQALGELKRSGGRYRLVIAGRHKGSEQYWQKIQQLVEQGGVREWIVERTQFIPDSEVEIYFKAADALVLPYLNIFQSGVMFLGYNFGLPVLAADVGSLKEEIVEGQTGFSFKAADPSDLARVIETYFGSPLYRELSGHRSKIQEYAADRYSWSKVAAITTSVYTQLVGK